MLSPSRDVAPTAAGTSGRAMAGTPVGGAQHTLDHLAKRPASDVGANLARSTSAEWPMTARTVPAVIQQSGR